MRFPCLRAWLQTLVWLAALALAGCGPGAPPPVTPAPSQPPPTANSPAAAAPLPAATASAQPTATPAATRPAPAPATSRYTLRARLDAAAHTLTVSETIGYANTSPAALPNLLLVVEPNWQPGIFQLDALTWGDRAPVEGWTLTEGILQIPLEPPLPAGGARTLQIAYTLQIPPRPGPFGYNPRQTNLGDWYPFIPPYDPALGWLAYRPGLVGEHLLYEAAAYEVEFTLENASPAVVVAASAPAQREGDTYRYELASARNFALSLSPEYVTFSQTAQTGLGPVELTSYAFPETRAAGEAALETTRAALEFFSETFGPYPHPALTIVEAAFPDGMEYDGLYFLSQDWYWAYLGNPASYLTLLAAHETAHQWFYGLLGSNQAMEPWLDEALATYCEALFYEHTAPDLVPWWWEYRVNLYAPEGSVDNSIYKFGAFRPYVDAVYLRGALFLQATREAMGDEAFMAALRAYAHENRHRLVTAEDFFAALRAHATFDLEAILAAFFETQ